MVGFFAVESYVARSAAGLVGAEELALLWDSALAPLRAAVERTLEGLSSPGAMASAKAHALLAASALEAAGCQVGEPGAGAALGWNDWGVGFSRGSDGGTWGRVAMEG